MPWDWNLVGELGVGIALGIGVGGAVFADRLEKAMLRVASHPSIRKLANAADKIQGAGSGGWPGLIASGLNFITGGRFQQGGGAPALPKGKMLVVNEAGEPVGYAEQREG